MLDWADVMNQDVQIGRISRRNWVRAIAFGLASQPLLAGSVEPSLNFPADARARLAVTSYPFRALLESPTNRGRQPGLPGMDLKDFPAFVADKFQVFNVNPLLDHFASTSDTYIAEFRAALERAKSHIVDLGLSGQRFYAADAAVRREAVTFGRKCIDIAVKVGSPSVRQHLDGHGGEKADVSLAASSLGEMAEYGASKNIVVNLENDSFVSEDPFFLTAVIEKVNSPYLRGLPDFGNSLVGHDQQFNERAVKSMLSHAFNMCHVKNAVEGAGNKLYQVDLAPLFELAKASGYRGYFSMEFDTAVGEAMAGTRRLVAETLRYLA